MKNTRVVTKRGICAARDLSPGEVILDRQPPVSILNLASSNPGATMPMDDILDQEFDKLSVLQRQVLFYLDDKSTPKGRKTLKGILCRGFQLLPQVTKEKNPSGWCFIPAGGQVVCLLNEKLP